MPQRIWWELVGWVKQTAAGVGIHLGQGWLIEPR